MKTKKMHILEINLTDEKMINKARNVIASSNDIELEQKGDYYQVHYSEPPMNTMVTVHSNNINIIGKIYAMLRKALPGTINKPVEFYLTSKPIEE